MPVVVKDSIDSSGRPSRSILVLQHACQAPTSMEMEAKTRILRYTHNLRNLGP